jgi:Pyruvate/2-oxoacid:ferredoxin oxidoreductase delta subunit
MVRVLTINDLISEGVREYHACIACRFCIGYCPVWGALAMSITSPPTGIPE